MGVGVSNRCVYYEETGTKFYNFEGSQEVLACPSGTCIGKS